MEPIFSVKTRSLPLKTAFEIAAFLQNALNATRLSFHRIMPGTVFGPHPKITKMDIARFAFKLFICVRQEVHTQDPNSKAPTSVGIPLFSVLSVCIVSAMQASRNGTMCKVSYTKSYRRWWTSSPAEQLTIHMMCLAMSFGQQTTLTSIRTVSQGRTMSPC